jgi:hypothetical protein
MARPAKWKAMVQASADEACLAVRLYNDPAERRAFEAFVVHMHMAWLYLLHAELTREDIDYRYRDPKNPRWLMKVDGEPKRWELAKCVSERLPANDPVRANLEFFIALRNRIEHRYAKHQETLALAVAGHCHALLINYEQRATTQFGADQSLAIRLRFPLFVGTFSTEGEQALLRLRSELPKPLQRFIADYHASLDPATANDSRFDFRLRVTLELANRDPDAMAVQFTRFDDMTPEQRSAVEEMGKTGQVIVREQKRAVANFGRLKPSQACQRVAERIPFRFTQNDFTLAYKALDVRPPTGSKHPERTKEQFCVYDAAHNDYTYTEAYVAHLADKLATNEGFREVVGRAPTPKAVRQAS